MAQTSTEKYSKTIASLIERISNASNILRNKAIDFGLIIPNTADNKWTTVEETVDKNDLPSVGNNSTIEDVAAAFDSIQLQNTLSLENNYYKKEVNIKVHTEEGETFIEGGELSAGYYPKGIKIYPIFKYEGNSTVPEANKNINIITEATIQTSLVISPTEGQSYYSIKPSDGYDYFKSLKLNPVSLGNINTIATTTITNEETNESISTLNPELVVTPGNTQLYIGKELYTGNGIVIDKVTAGVGLISSIDTIQLKSQKYNNTTHVWEDSSDEGSVSRAVAQYTPTTDDDTDNDPAYFSAVDIDVTSIISNLVQI